MAHRTIPQRELRNDIAGILREAEAGTEFTVTVRGRPVAKLGPLDEAPGPRRYVDRETLRRFFERHPPDHAMHFIAEIQKLFCQVTSVLAGDAGDECFLHPLNGWPRGLVFRSRGMLYDAGSL